MVEIILVGVQLFFILQCEVYLYLLGGDLQLPVSRTSVYRMTTVCRCGFLESDSIYIGGIAV